MKNKYKALSIKILEIKIKVLINILVKEFSKYESSKKDLIEGLIKTQVELETLKKIK